MTAQRAHDGAPLFLADPGTALEEALVATRRDLHRHAERGWSELRTVSVIVRTLERLGWDVAYGRAVVEPGARMGLPPAAVLAQERERALAQGADPEICAAVGEGLTGVVARLPGSGAGPKVTLRFDIDANNGDEAQGSEHRPARLGFASVNPGANHNCGHDGHVAIGLGLARLLAEARDARPPVTLVFQPAEEGGRGAESMVAAGVLDDAEVLLGCHIGVQARRNGQIVSGYDHLLASTKLDAAFEGLPAHAALAPQEGRNALQAAVVAVQGLLSIPRHGDGETYVNVAYLEAGEARSEARNIVPAHARFRAEVRGRNDAISEYMTGRALAVVAGAAAMHGVEHAFDRVGRTIAASSDPALVRLVARAAAHVAGVDEVTPTLDFRAGDDVSAMMRAVQEAGGLAAYVGVGAELAAGHHTPTFDFDEGALARGVELLDRALGEIASAGPGAGR